MEIVDCIREILKNDVKPAVGCTEPVAIALATAAAAEQLNGDLTEIHLDICPNVYKNGMDVGIPGIDLIGLDVAAALGASVRASYRKLEILSDIDEETKTRAKKYLNEELVRISLLDTEKKIHIIATVSDGEHTSRAIVMDRHDHIERVEKDGEVIVENTLSGGMVQQEIPASFYDSRIMDIITEIEKMQMEELSFMLDGIRMNEAVAEEGLKKKYGVGVGYGMKEAMDKGILGKDFPNTAMMLTAAASDVRMSGASVPVMSSSGSGNNGLTAIIPIIAYSRFYETDELSLARAVAISHVVTAYVKYYIGRLSSLCGCSIAASTGSATAITWLMGGREMEIQGVIKNIMANQSGVICDGAKAACALKLGTAAISGVQSVLLALSGDYLKENNGIVTNTAEETIKNLGKLSKEGMYPVDRTIIEIMEAGR